jgi:hypothetical protein
MDYEKIYEESQLDASLQSVEDDLPVKENWKSLFEQILKEMTNSQIAAYAPVKLDGSIDTDYIKNERELDSLKQFVSQRKNIYKGYALIDVSIEKIVKQFEV